MEKVVANELSKTLLLLAMGVAGISALLIRMIAKVYGSFKEFQSATLVYALVACAFFAAVACSGYWSVIQHHTVFYISYQAVFSLTGIAHVYWMHQFLKWSGDGRSVWLELGFTLVIAMLGSIGFMLVFRLVNHERVEHDMATSIGAFLIPWFIAQSFYKACSIPAKVFRLWFYPVNQDIKEPDESLLRNPRIISFEFRKQTNDPHPTRFRAKAPAGMGMGELFYHFINDYNERFPDSRIQYLDAGGQAYGWTFYRKLKWYTWITRRLRTDITVQLNRIREDDVIVCNRWIQ